MNLTTSMIVLAILAAAPAPAEGSPLLGRWRTAERGGVIELYRCQAAVCGRLIDAAPLHANPDQRDVRNPNADLRARRLKNLVILTNFTGGPSKWTGASLYDPNTGNSASTGTLTLSGPDQLTVKGCVASIFCRTQIWTRLR